jgi:hypothetical protein
MNVYNFVPFFWLGRFVPGISAPFAIRCHIHPSVVQFIVVIVVVVVIFIRFTVPQNINKYDVK